MNSRPESADDGADLIRRNHIAIEHVGGVGEVFIELLPALCARLAVALVDVEAGVDGEPC